MVPVYMRGTLTNVLPQWNVMPQTQDMSPHPVRVYRHGADLSLCYPMMWTVAREYTTTHVHVFESDPTEKVLPRPSTHTPANAQLYDAAIVIVSQKLCRKCILLALLTLRPVVCESITLTARLQLPHFILLQWRHGLFYNINS